MITEAWMWAILFLPLGSFLASGLIIRPFFNRYSVLAGYATIISIGIALVLSIWALRSVVDAGGDLEFATRSWLEVGGLSVTVGILLDPLMDLPDISKIVITPEMIEDINKTLKESAEYWEKIERANASFTSECRCHTRGICYFHTRF